MAGPWEQYQQKDEAGPWAKYREPKADFSRVQSRVTPPKGPGALDEAKRTLGLGARAMMQGGADLVGIVADPVIVGMNKLGANQATMRQGAGMMADRIGLPSPASAGERISGDVTSALTGGGGIIGMGRGLAARAPGIGQAVGETLTSMPRTQLASIVGGAGASSSTRESGGGQGAQTLAGLAGGLSPSGVKTAGAAGLRGLVRGGETGREAMQRGLDDFRSVGAQPSVGQAVGNRRMQGIESLLAGSPTASSRMAQFAERQAEDIGGGLRSRADQFSPNASAERAGRAIEKGADTFAGNVRATRNALYWQADQVIPADARLPLTNTQRALSELTALTPGAESTTAVMVNPKIAQLAKTVGEDMRAAQLTGTGGLPYAAVKDIRSKIGAELSDFSLSADKPTAQYKRLYAALSQDLEQAARQHGPTAEAAAKRANNYTRASADRLEQVQRVVDKNGGPEKVYNAVMSGTQDGGTTLRAVMQSLPKDGQRALTAAVIKKMGLATPGQQGAAGDVFSAQTFLTNWNRVSPEARRALFDRHGPQFAKDMDKIARVADRIRTGSKVFANPSGTANRAAAIGYYGSLPAAGIAGAMGAGPLPLVGLVLSGVGANVTARALTNPRIVSWLAKATEMPVSALPQQLVVLKQIARDDADAAELLAELEAKQAENQ